MNFNTTGWTEQKRSDIKKNEMNNYDSFVRKSPERGLNDVIVVFDSADSLVKHFMHNVKEAGGNGTWVNDSSGIYSSGDINDVDTWTFGKDYPTFSKTIKALESGEVKDRYIKMFEEVKFEMYQKYPELYKLSETAVTKKRRRKFSEDGDELDIDRMMCGDPSMWMSLPKQVVAGKATTFFIDIGISAGVKTEILVESVIRSIALVDIVDKAGIATEIVVGAVTNKPTIGTRFVTPCCKAKHANEPLDLSRLLSFCLPGFFRSLIFNAYINLSEGRMEISGLGNGAWDFERNKEYFDFFNAIVKTRCRDHYWVDSSEMEVNIKNITNFINP